MPEIKVFPFNPLQVNCYLLFEPNGPGILIDASCMSLDELNEVKEFIRMNAIKLDYLLNTHGHFDHVFGVSGIMEAYHPKFLIHRDDVAYLQRAADQAMGFGFDFDGRMPDPDGYLTDGEVIATGNISLSVIHVPGHSQGSVAFFEASPGWLFSGDTLFAGGIGRTDLPGGNYEQIISGIKHKLMILPDDTRVFPGHGPSTTIRAERLTNPFL
jgi:hydroxyacylglutathione hydrolase